VVSIRPVVATFLPFTFQKAKSYDQIASDYQAAIDNVLWNKDVGTWLDYDMKNKQSRNAFYPTNLSPLNTMSYDQMKRNAYARHAVSYLKKNKIDMYFGKLNGCSSRARINDISFVNIKPKQCASACVSLFSDL